MEQSARPDTVIFGLKQVSQTNLRPYSHEFREKMRAYNTVFQLTSFECNVVSHDVELREAFTLQGNICHHLGAYDHPDIVRRVFDLKLRALLKQLKGGIVGHQRAILHTIGR